MRMRKRKWVAPFMESENHYLLKDKKDTSKFIGLDNLYLEVGSGLGAFITSLAEANPDKIYIAMEKDQTCVAKSIKLAMEKDLKNLYFINDNADYIREWFEGISFNMIFLLFSDPWPKKAYAKRRLTSVKYLEEFKALLKTGGEIYFKTDNTNLYEYTEEEILKIDLVKTVDSKDFHHEIKDGYPLTGYESKFIAEGMNIYHIRLTKN